MWRLSNIKSSKSGERIDFKFSDFQAIQVPKGWDNLLVSIISVETGKTIAKSNKALVKNGNCQWNESLSESLWISHDAASKELEDHLFKVVVSMGSARSGILGEATVNMAHYFSSRASVPISLPLNKCNFGTTLQVQIQCLSSRTKLRVEESRSTNSDAGNQDAGSEDVGSGSKASVVSVTRSINSAKSRSSQDLGSPSHPEKYETSYLASDSDHNTGSAEVSLEKEKFYLENDTRVVKYNLNARHGITSSSSAHNNYPVDEPFMSNHSSFKSRITHSGDDLQNHEQEFGQSPPLTNSGSSRNLLETAEDTIEELRDEAKMWERNARKQMLDLDILREKYSDQLRKLADMEIELSASRRECDIMKKEVYQMQLYLEESMMRQKATAGTSFQTEGASLIQWELEKEIKFQEETNASLALHLKRSQVSNAELLCILQEMEETIEKQKKEVEELPVVQLKVIKLEKSIKAMLEEKSEFLLQLEQLEESEETLNSSVQFLEQALADKNFELQNERSSNRKSLLDLEREYRSNLSVKEDDIVCLEEKLSEYLKEREERLIDHMQETEALTGKVKKLETDCSELTSENLELHCKLKVSTKLIEENQRAASETANIFSEIIKQLDVTFLQVKKPWHNTSYAVSDECTSHLDNLVNVIKPDSSESIVTYFSKLNILLGARITQCEEILRSDEVQIAERNKALEEARKQREDYSLKLQNLESTKVQLEAMLTNLRKEMEEERAEAEKLEGNLKSKKAEIDFLRHSHMELEARVSDLTTEKDQLQENMEIALRESNITSKCLDDLRNDLVVLSSSVDSQVSANKILERKSSELEKGKREVELHLLEVKEEKVQLSEQISALKAQLCYVTDERESRQLEVESLKSVTTGLRDEIRRLADEMDKQERDLKKKLTDLDDKMSNVQKECEYEKEENQKLQASAESLIDECNNLQKSYEELRRVKAELSEHCSYLETELTGARKSLSLSSKSAEALERKITSMVEDFASTEKCLTSELDVLRQQNWQLSEKISLEESLLNQMFLEKTAEIGELRMEIEQLRMEVSALNEEKERIAAEDAQEISSLHGDREKLESEVKEYQSRVELTTRELHNVRMDLESKIQSSTVELAASKEKKAELTTELAALTKIHEKCEKKLKLLGGYRSREEKLKTAVNDLELKLTVSEYERERLIEDAANLKAQMQKTTQLQDEVLVLKRKLDELKSEKEKLEGLVLSLNGKCDEMISEKMSSVETISSLQKSMSEFEDCKDKRMALEEKLLRLEGDLTAKQAFYAQASETKNELTRLKRGNLQYQLKIQQLEGEKDECIKRAEGLEEDLKSLTAKQIQSNTSSKKVEISASRDGSSYDEMDYIAKVEQLEAELDEALDANSKYRIQLKRLLAEGGNKNNSVAAGNKSNGGEGEVVAKERYERTKSSLETELKEIRDRYFQMSLRYAEVEAEREDLVMKLKSNHKSGRRSLKRNEDLSK